MELSGNKCYCSTCGKYFKSTFAFDKHRIGSHKNQTRRCMTTIEMVKACMVQDDKGYWLSCRNPNYV